MSPGLGLVLGVTAQCKVGQVVKHKEVTRCQRPVTVKWEINTSAVVGQRLLSRLHIVTSHKTRTRPFGVKPHSQFKFPGSSFEGIVKISFEEQEWEKCSPVMRGCFAA